jgi:hypothetical protein
MALFSWFNSADQVDTALIYVSIFGAIIEVGVAVAAIINVHKELGEARKKKLEKYIEVFSCVAAFFFLAEAILACRSSGLLRKELENIKVENKKLESHVDNVDPLNQPIVTVSATVDLWMNGVTQEHSRFPTNEINSTQLAFGNPSEETHGAPTLFFSNANFVNRPNSQTEWLFLFNEKPLSFSFPNKLVRDWTNWSVFELSVRFLPPGTQVTKGTINLTINSMPKTVIILPQKVKNHETDFDEYLKSPTAGVTVFGK